MPSAPTPPDAAPEAELNGPRTISLIATDRAELSFRAAHGARFRNPEEVSLQRPLRTLLNPERFRVREARTRPHRPWSPQVQPAASLCCTLPNLIRGHRAASPQVSRVSSDC